MIVLSPETNGVRFLFLFFANRIQYARIEKKEEKRRRVGKRLRACKGKKAKVASWVGSRDVDDWPRPVPPFCGGSSLSLSLRDRFIYLFPSSLLCPSFACLWVVLPTNATDAHGGRMPRLGVHPVTDVCVSSPESSGFIIPVQDSQSQRRRDLTRPAPEEERKCVLSS